MTHWPRRLKFGGLFAAIGMIALGASAHAEPYVHYHSYSAAPPSPAPGSVWYYHSYHYGPPNCRFRATLAGPAHSPEFGFDYRCFVPVERAPARRRSVVKVRG